MKSFILSLSSVTPKTHFSQKNVARTFERSLNLDKNDAKKLHQIFQNACIETRYSVLEDYGSPSLQGEFFGDNFPNTIPDTHQRNQVYIQEAPRLAIKSSQQAINDWGQPITSITHVISVSCTGMYAPGIELKLIESLGLKSNVERFGINFMGCFGAFKGLALADALAKENPKNRILVVCTELCSLHFQADKNIETFVINALFADGSACAIVGCDPQKNETCLFQIEKRGSEALADTQQDMTWELGNNGMKMRLSSKVPQLFANTIYNFTKEFLCPISSEECEWAIHPGGKSILKEIERICALKPNQTEESWKVLENFGNMSSATFLFILDRIRLKKEQFPYVIGLGFGPGLSVEGILLQSMNNKKE